LNWDSLSEPRLSTLKWNKYRDKRERKISDGVQT